MLTALIAALPLAAFAGSLGCVVLWRGMAYFGDAMAHAAMLGVALSLITPSVPVALCVFAVIVAASILMQRTETSRAISPNTALAIIAYGALSIGILLMLLQGASSVDLHAYLLGDMLSLSNREAYLTAAVSVAGLFLVASRWRAFVLLATDAALARVSGLSPAHLKWLFTLLLSMLVAFAVPLVGILLVTALLIIPSAAARFIAHNPAQMGIASAMIAVLGTLAGVKLAFVYDLPPAPAIVALLSALFVVVTLLKRAR